VSNIYQKTSRCAEPDPLPGEIIVPEQVMVSMTEIAGAARETCLALAGRHRPAGDGGHVRRGRDSAVRPGRQAQPRSCRLPSWRGGWVPQARPAGERRRGRASPMPSHQSVRRHRPRACVLDAGETPTCDWDYQAVPGRFLWVWGSRGRGFKSRRPDHEVAGQKGVRRFSGAPFRSSGAKRGATVRRISLAWLSWPAS